jgi:hypothetical protein
VPRLPISRGEMWLGVLDPTIGSETQKTRACLLVSPAQMNEYLRTTLVAPLAGMDRNTMIVRSVEALLWFGALVVVILRLDRLWLRLRELQLHLGESIKVSARFFRQERRIPHHITRGMAHLVAGDQLAIDHLIITHP